MKMKSVLIISLIILISVFGVSQLMTLYYPGFTVTSISTSQVISSQTELSGVWFNINTVFNGGSQYVVGTLTPEETKRESGYKTQYPLEIKVGAVKESVNIPIVNDGDVLGGIYEYRLKYVDGWIVRPSRSECPSGTNYYINGGFDVGGISLKTRLWCVQKILVGTKGHLESPSVKWNADITLMTRGESVTKRISSEETSVVLSDRASAQWVGSLVTGDAPPIVSNYVATFVDGARWKIAYAESWISAKTNYQITDSFFKQAQDSGIVYNSPGGTSDLNWERQPTLEGYISNVKSITNYLIGQDVSISSNSVVQNAYDKNAGKVVFSPGVRLTNAWVTFRVRADWVGVVIEAGKPQIVSIASDKFGSGETGSIRLSVKNIGGSQGAFVPTLSECPTFSQRYSGETLKKVVPAGETENFVVELSHGTVNVDVTETCKVRVFDYSYPINFDEKPVSVSMTASKLCTPGQYSAEGNVIYLCNTDGTKRDVVKTCEGGVGWKSGGEYGGYYCLSVGGNKCDDGTPYGQCSSTKPMFCYYGQLVSDETKCGGAGACVLGYNVFGIPDIFGYLGCMWGIYGIWVAAMLVLVLVLYIAIRR